MAVSEQVPGDTGTEAGGEEQERRGHHSKQGQRERGLWPEA